MSINKKIDSTIDEIINSTHLLQKVTVNPFFKDKTLDVLFDQTAQVGTEAKSSWLSPKLQFATLICVIILNVLAVTELKEITYEEKINQFAESYGLVLNTENALLN